MNLAMYYTVVTFRVTFSITEWLYSPLLGTSYLPEKERTPNNWLLPLAISLCFFKESVPPSSPWTPQEHKRATRCQAFLSPVWTKYDPFLIQHAVLPLTMLVALQQLLQLALYEQAPKWVIYRWWWKTNWQGSLKARIFSHNGLKQDCRQERQQHGTPQQNKTTDAVGQVQRCEVLKCTEA